MPDPDVAPGPDRRVVAAAFGGPEVLEVVEAPIPTPGPGEVRVRVEASSVQFTDTMIRARQYVPFVPDLPFTPGYDLVGRVEATGEGAQRWSVGDRVADLTVVGGNARYAIRPADGLVGVPEEVDAAEAATLVLSWVTASQALWRAGDLAAGERVLVVGGMGAVGQAAVTLATMQGHEVWATARASHAEALAAMGARPLDYRDPDWERQVLDAGGVDVAIDGVGERGFRRSRSVLRRGGRLIGLGSSSAAAPGAGRWAMAKPFLPAFLANLWPDGRRFRLFSITEHRKAHPEHFQQDLTQLLGWLAAGRIRPEVEARIPLEGVADAHAQLEEGGLTGKVVVLPWS